MGSLETIILIAFYIGVALIPLIYNHMKIANDREHGRAGHVTASTRYGGRNINNVIIVFNDVDERLFKDLIEHLKKIVRGDRGASS